MRSNGLRMGNQGYTMYIIQFVLDGMTNDNI